MSTTSSNLREKKNHIKEVDRTRITEKNCKILDNVELHLKIGTQLVSISEIGKHVVSRYTFYSKVNVILFRKKNLEITKFNCFGIMVRNYFRGN